MYSFGFTMSSIDPLANMLVNTMIRINDVGIIRYNIVSTKQAIEKSRSLLLYKLYKS